MKILFAVNNDNVSEAIVKKYQKEYKEILSYKNVYYFNAILRELQKDKSYSRIVISEDLEPFANNNYDAIDKFLFDKYNNISEEAKDVNNDRIDIILVCADRRKKTDNMLAKIYNKEIYNAIIGQDRSIDEICKLINRPRDKERARAYYGIYESELGQTESENSVSEAEVENIRAHYARLGKNEDKYVESFNNIVAQYTDTQLRIIIKYLPMNVKAVLEERSAKYQQLAINSNLTDFDARKKTLKYKERIKHQEEEETNTQDDLVQQFVKPKNIKSVVIPENITTKNVQKIVVPKIEKPQIDMSFNNENALTNKKMVEEKIDEPKIIEIEEEQEPTNNIEEQPKVEEQLNSEEQPKRGRGRPRKNPLPQEQEEKPKRGRGRPRKNPEPEIEDKKVNTDVELFNITEPEKKQEEPEVDLFNIEEPEIDLFSMEEPEEKQEEPEIDLFSMEEPEEKQKEPEVDLFNIEEPEAKQEEPEMDLFNIKEPEIRRKEPEQDFVNTYTERKEEQKVTIPNAREFELENKELARTNYTNTNFSTLLTADKKIVAFVGTTKNGTSFVVNNTAEMLSSMGIETAILDMTKTKNAYYIYTQNEESLRNTARRCIENLQMGVPEGIKVHRNLTVYTEMPGEEREYQIDKMFETLLNNYSAILIDTDFSTSPEIFAKVQEIYLVQTMDVLTIQPLTAFLRNLKSKDILKPEKLKVVINKSQKIRSLNIKTLIGGMSCYNSPSMTYMTELFNKDTIPYCEIPFEIQNYVKYLDSLVNCSIALNGYTKTFIASLQNLANMVYPLINKQTYKGKQENREPFSNQVNDTLNKMKKRY